MAFRLAPFARRPGARITRSLVGFGASLASDAWLVNDLAGSAKEVWTRTAEVC